jgi:hypothetical protein
MNCREDARAKLGADLPEHATSLQCRCEDAGEITAVFHLDATEKDVGDLGPANERGHDDWCPEAQLRTRERRLEGGARALGGRPKEENG